MSGFLIVGILHRVHLEWLKLDFVIFVLVLIHIKGKIFEVRILTVPKKTPKV